jgi:hypothetical protein
MSGVINFIVTIHNMRTRGMSWMRIPLFVWSIEIYSWLLLVVLLAGLMSLSTAVPRHVPLLRPRGPTAAARPFRSNVFRFSGTGLRDDPGDGDHLEILPFASGAYLGKVCLHGRDRLLLVARGRTTCSRSGCRRTEHLVRWRRWSSPSTGMKIFNWLATSGATSR